MYKLEKLVPQKTVYNGVVSYLLSAVNENSILQFYADNRSTPSSSNFRSGSRYRDLNQVDHTAAAIVGAVSSNTADHISPPMWGRIMP